MDLQTLTHMPNFATLLSFTKNLRRRVTDTAADPGTSTILKIQLKELESIISRIEYVLNLYEAYDREGEPCNADVTWFERLRLAIYEADDYIDKLITLGQQKKEILPSTKSPKYRFFRKMQQQLLCSSSDHELPAPDLTSEKVRGIQERLSSIAREVEPEAEGERYRCRRTKGKKTDSFVNAGDVIGREDDQKAVVDMLLNSNADEDSDCCFSAIVGLAGIGKTTLAQLVFNDPRVVNEFPLRLWVSVSDCDYGEYDFYNLTILHRILESMTGQRVQIEGEIDAASKIHEMLRGKRYLVVLDDVWCENYEIWGMVRGSLDGGLRGSKIMVTTRSRKTARVMSIYGHTSDITYNLEGLSEESSWHLFQMTAFRHMHGLAYPPKLVVMGKNIVKNCFNVPLAIKAMGDFLSRQKLNTWQSFQEGGSAMIVQRLEIWPVLKLSYDMLGHKLQSCFSSCAVFPYDHVMSKRMLISMWMAQGYVDHPSDGESSFSILLERLFFEVAEMDEDSEIVSCRIHNLMHAFAKVVASGDTYPHLDQFGDGMPSAVRFYKYLNLVRSCHQESLDHRSVHILVNMWFFLRVLHLRGFKAKILPDSIGQLLHLRYLNVSHSKYLEALPNAIVNLCNLQTLDLSFCALLKELPQEFCKLSNLRCLDMLGCDGLACLPPNMDKLTCLQLLSQFVVAEANSSDKQFCSQLRELKSLVNLEGRICILIPKSYTHVKRIEGGGGCLEVQEHLRLIFIQFMETHSADGNDARIVNYHQSLLEKLQPHPNLKELLLWGFQGSTIPRWGRAEDNWANILPNLVKVEIRSCERLQQLPLLSQLCHLKSLKLYGLRNLEFLENTNSSSTSAEVSESLVEETAFFPCLEELEIVNAPKLIGFRVSNFKERAEHSCVNFAPNLVTLKLRSCERLQQIPSLSKHSNLKSVSLYNLSKLEYLEETSWPSTSATTLESIFFPSIEDLEIVSMPQLRGCWRDDNGVASPATPCFISLKYLMLANLPELTGWLCAEGADVDGEEDRRRNNPCMLQLGCILELSISDCPKLMSMPNLPSLESLDAVNIHQNLLKCLLLAQGSPMSSSTVSKLCKVNIVSIFELHDLSINLSKVESLTIRQCQKLTSLDLVSCSSLRRLILHECDGLKFLPQHLSSLEELDTDACEELNLYEQNEDWLSLQSLRSLKLTNISKLKSLPLGLSHLTRLEELSLCWLYNLSGLPDWIEKLSQLRQLTIQYCPNLTVLPKALASQLNAEHIDIHFSPLSKQLPVKS